MKPYDGEAPRPGILNLIVVVSFAMTALDVVWVVMVVILAVGTSALSWFGGPVVGGIVTLFAAVFLLFAVVRSLFAIVLFLAAWKTLSGDPGGRSLHRTWAWMTVVLDVLDLLFTGGMSPAAWWGLVYAAGVLYVMGLPEVVAYFDRGLGPPWPQRSLDDLA